MKAYILSEDDFKALLAAIDRDPRYGRNGGSSQTLSKLEEEAFAQSHGFFNYQVRSWIDRVQK